MHASDILRATIGSSYLQSCIQYSNFYMCVYLYLDYILLCFWGPLSTLLGHSNSLYLYKCSRLPFKCIHLSVVTMVFCRRVCVVQQLFKVKLLPSTILCANNGTFFFIYLTPYKAYKLYKYQIMFASLHDVRSVRMYSSKADKLYLDRIIVRSTGFSQKQQTEIEHSPYLEAISHTSLYYQQAGGIYNSGARETGQRDTKEYERLASRKEDLRAERRENARTCRVKRNNNRERERR